MVTVRRPTQRCSAGADCDALVLRGRPQQVIDEIAASTPSTGSTPDDMAERSLPWPVRLDGSTVRWV